MKSIVLLAFTLCLVGLLSTLALLSQDAASPLSRQLLRRGNRAHAPGFFNVDDSTSSDSSSPRVRRKTFFLSFFSSSSKKMIFCVFFAFVRRVRRTVVASCWWAARTKPTP
jgi:hypothetical protein